MAKIQAVWSIDIGQAALKALKLAPTAEDPEKIYAEAFDFVEYPKILSQPDADAEELVREALTTFLERNDLKGCKVALGVSGQAGLVKFVKLPPVEKSRIPDIVKFEARQHIPFALDEVIWSYQQIGGDASEEEFAMVEIGLFAMKREQINRAINPLKNAGIEVDVVQMGPIALYNYIAFDDPPPERGEKDDGPISYVLLDIGADNTDLIITDGTRIWQRNVPIGGNHFTRALTKELKQTFAKAEHLKRNATKAPDPKAIFTAMRGIFGDFASEVQRSIGFYSSVNRQAKIAKIIGLGNGFKLPGLQKFLHQNLNQEVERLDKFQKLTGDEVITAPQFQENIGSFAVPYGLAIQGLGVGRMKTNLLPPEIEQVRMIRRKKPWTLAAAALLMLGFSALFVSAWAGYEKVRPLDEPAKQAKTVADQGGKYESDFATAKNEFSQLKKQGENLVADTPDSASWPAVLKLVLGTLPNPAAEFQESDPEFDPNAPANVPLLGMLRVHIDKIIPVWRNDLKSEWFDLLPKELQSTMHPYDQANPPSGPGYVIQVIGHHYNPSPIGPLKDQLTKRQKSFARGPSAFIATYILPRFWWSPELRLAGLRNAALTWIFPDSQWTSEKGATQVPPPPLLAKGVAKAAEGQAAAATGAADPAAMMKGVMGGMDASMPMGGVGRGGMIGMMAGPGASQATDKKNMTFLTRTDFKLELAWQPPKPGDATKDDTDIGKKAEELKKSLAEAEKKKGIPKLDEANLVKVSDEESKKALVKAVQEVEQENQKTAAGTAAPAQPPANTNPPATGAEPGEGGDTKPQE